MFKSKTSKPERPDAPEWPRRSPPRMPPIPTPRRPARSRSRRRSFPLVPDAPDPLLGILADDLRPIPLFVAYAYSFQRETVFVLGPIITVDHVIDVCWSGNTVIGRSLLPIGADLPDRSLALIATASWPLLLTGGDLPDCSKRPVDRPEPGHRAAIDRPGPGSARNA